MHPSQNYGAPFRFTTAGTAQSVASIPNPGTRSRIFITDVSGSADRPATIVLSVGGVALWQDQLTMNFSGGTTTHTYHHSFGTPLAGTANAAGTVVVGSATSLSWVNVAGYTV